MRALRPKIEPRFASGAEATVAPIGLASRDKPQHPAVLWFEISAFAAFAVAIFFGVPMGLEETSGPCSAVEAKFVNYALPISANSPIGLAMVQSLVKASDGSVAFALAKRLHPNLPPSAGCAAVYWKSMFDPSQLEAMRAAANPGAEANASETYGGE